VCHRKKSDGIKLRGGGSRGRERGLEIPKRKGKPLGRGEKGSSVEVMEVRL